MNLETKITIYKFTPQLFTLTQQNYVNVLDLIYWNRGNQLYCTE